MRRIGLAAAALVLVVGGAACSDSDGDATSSEGEEDASSTEGQEDASSTEGQEYADALAAGMSQEGSGVSEDEAECVGEAMVDSISVEKLAEHGTPEEYRKDAALFEQLEFDEKGAQSLYDGIDGCMDYRALVLDQLSAGGVSDKGMDCYEEIFTDKMAEETFVYGVQGKTPGEGSDLAAAEGDLRDCNEM